MTDKLMAGIDIAVRGNGNILIAAATTTKPLDGAGALIQIDHKVIEVEVFARRLLILYNQLGEPLILGKNIRQIFISKRIGLLRIGHNRLKRAHLLGGPQTMDKCIDSEDRAYLPSGITKTLSSMDFVNDGRNLCILGPSDSGKSYLAKALGINACLHYRTSYHHCEEFLESLVAVKQNDYVRYQKKVRFYIKLDLLILDNFLLHTISDERELKVLFEILEKRSELSRSTIVCSQREPNSWASMILNDEVSANAILKRATKHYTVVIKPQS